MRVPISLPYRLLLLAISTEAFKGVRPPVFSGFSQGKDLSRTHTQALGGVGFLTLVSGMMTKTHVSKGRSAGIKTAHWKGLWTN